MKGVAHWFFGTAVLAAVGGMGWGILMAATGEHLQAAAHAHLNLVGWASMGLFGMYYHLVPAATGRLACLHYGLALTGLILMIPGIAIATAGGSEALAKMGSMFTMISMVVFAATVLRHGRLR